MLKLYQYQAEDLQRIEELGGRCLITWEPGLGKGPLALSYLNNHPEIKTAVVVCPAFLKWHWKSEARKHFGLKSEVLETRNCPRKLRQHQRLLIINYEILKDWVDYLIALKPDLVIGDECQYVSSRQSKRTRAFKKLCKGVQHILPLSGTPLVNRPVELYPILNILWPTKFPRFFDYGQYYCNGKRTYWGWDYSGASNTKELNKLLQECGMVRRLKKDVLGQLPPKTRTVIPLDISNRKEYEAAEEDFIKWLKVISPSRAKRAKKAVGVTKLSYLKQLSASSKLERVYDWIDNFLKESDEKLILFCVHRKIIDSLVERYKKIAIKVDGSVTGIKRQKAFDLFNAKNGTRIFVGNIKAAGVGWSCRSASTVCFVELSWTSGDHLQAEDRISGLNRGIEGRGANIVYLVGKDTVEMSLCKILQRKQRIISSVLDGKRTTKLDVYTALCKALERKVA